MRSIVAFSLIASLPIVLGHGHSHNHHGSFVRVRRAGEHRNSTVDIDDIGTAVLLADAPIAPSALTEADGCEAYYAVPKGDYCLHVAKKHGLTLAQFYALNPGVDERCSNLWANYKTCVKGSAKPKPAPKQVVVPKKAAAKKPVVKAVQAAKPAPEAPAKVAKPSPVKEAEKPAETLAEPEDDEDDEECEAEDDEEDDDEDEDDEQCEPEDDDDAEADAASEDAPSSTPKSTSSSPKSSDSDSSQGESSSDDDASTGSSVSSSGVVSNIVSKLDSVGIKSFHGKQTGIGSWFRTNSAQDSTNGRSWCQIQYTDDMPGIAINVATMLNDFGGDYDKAGKAYCGQPVKVTAPNGNSLDMVIIDGFDPKWVRTPGSIDIVKGSFEKLFGRTTDNKNDVIQNIAWEFTTGVVDPQYAFKAS